jgi:HEAT repeat protein
MLFGDKALRIDKFVQKRHSKSILPLLNDRRPEVRNKALQALAKIADDTSINTLINMLSDKDPAIRKIVADNMGSMTSQTVKSHLQHQILVEKDEGVMKAIKDALAKMPRIS